MKNYANSATLVNAGGAAKVLDSPSAAPHRLALA